MPIYRTQDSHKDPKLQTRWYQNDYKEASNAMITIVRNFGFELTHQDDTYGEFVFIKKDSVLDVKIVSLQRKQTAIDFTLNIKNMFDFGRGKGVIYELYQRLEKSLSEKSFI